jgi:hypothetical protein
LIEPEIARPIREERDTAGGTQERMQGAGSGEEMPEAPGFGCRDLVVSLRTLDFALGTFVLILDTQRSE